MSSSLRTSLLGVTVVALAGCVQSVRESREVNWSADGKEVAVAHGHNGVFIATKEGALQEIFHPDDAVLATSPPLWAPHGRRLLFTVARSATPEKKGQRADADPPPDGAVVFRGNTVYSCYLWDESKGDGKREPVMLFTAPCDHVGYVAANLAVRWSPDGRRVLFVQQLEQDAHSLFEYDLETKSTRRVIPHAAPALVFDFSPDGTFLSCVFGRQGQRNPNDGLWISPAATNHWWHVPQSELLARGEFDSVLERLRATRPVWSADGSRFVFVTYGLSFNSPSEPCWYCPFVLQFCHRLNLVSLMDQTMKVIGKSQEPIRDLAWSPDGARIGMVRGGECGSLHLFRPEDGPGAPFVDRPVRRFAGWDRTGKRLAYVAVDKVPGHVEPAYNWLLVSASQPRDALFVVSDGEAGLETPTLSGARFTFLKWSPTEPVLSLWITFTPTHRSWYSLRLEAGLQPGDPAAIYDPRTATLSWKPVNAHEQTQIGHFYLVTRDAAEAWRWYQKAENAAAALTPDQRLEAILAGRDATFFHYLCAARLGQMREAAEQLRYFHEAFRPRAGALPARHPFAAAPPARLNHLRDRYVAEVYLSLGALREGEDYFRAGLDTAAEDDERLSKALVLSQFLLVDQRHEEYAKLCTDVVLPLLGSRGPTQTHGSRDSLEKADYQAVLPLSCSEFLASLPVKRIEALLPQWDRLRAATRTDEQRLVLDLILAAAFRHRRCVAEADTANEHVQQNPEWQRNRRMWDAAEVAQSARAASRR